MCDCVWMIKIYVLLQWDRITVRVCLCVCDCVWMIKIYVLLQWDRISVRLCVWLCVDDQDLRSVAVRPYKRPPVCVWLCVDDQDLRSVAVRPYKHPPVCVTVCGWSRSTLLLQRDDASGLRPDSGAVEQGNAMGQTDRNALAPAHQCEAFEPSTSRRSFVDFRASARVEQFWVIVFYFIVTV